MHNTWGLSERQESMLALLAQGHCNKEIAYALCLSPSTVKNAMAVIYNKMDIPAGQGGRVLAAVAWTRREAERCARPA